MKTRTHPPSIFYLTANGFPKSATDPKGTFSLEHANALRIEGAHVAAFDMSNDAFGEDEIGGLRIRRIPRLRPLLKAFKIKEVRQYLGFLFFLKQQTRGKWVIFSFFYAKYLPLIMILKWGGARILIIPHGGDVMHDNILGRLIKKAMFRLADLVTPVSDYTETLLSCLIRRTNHDNRKIITIYNGVNLQKLRAVEITRSEMRTRFGIPETDFVVLSVCNLVKRKGIDIVMQGIIRLLEKGHSLHHVIIGTGPEYEQLKGMAQQSGFDAHFHFIQSVGITELSSHYNMADLFAMISVTDWETQQTEGFGITYAEAMALGRPVIGGGGSGTNAPIKHGFNGILKNPYSPTIVEDVAKTIDKFMSDTDFYAKTSRNAEWYAETFLSWNLNAITTLNAMKTIDPAA